MKLVPAVDGEVLGVVSLVNATVSQPEGGCFEVKSIARPSVVFEESAPDNLMPSARAAPTPRAYSMALQTLPTSLKRTNKAEDSLSDERCGSGASSRYQAWQINGTGHTGPSEFCATSI